MPLSLFVQWLYWDLKDILNIVFCCLPSLCPQFCHYRVIFTSWSCFKHKMIVCHLWRSWVDFSERQLGTLGTWDRNIQAHGTTQTSMGWHAGILKCLLGASLKPTWVFWWAWGVPNISLWFLKSALACIWSISALCLLSSLRIALKDPQEMAETLLKNSYLGTHWLVHLHIPV